MKNLFWHNRAKCKGVDYVEWRSKSSGGALRRTEWIPSKSEITEESTEAVGRFCQTCPVRVDCLRDALKTGEPGYWGGTSPYQRAQLTRIRGRVKCPVCKGADLVLVPEVTHVQELCIGCGLSWVAGKRPAEENETQGRKTA